MCDDARLKAVGWIGHWRRLLSVAVISALLVGSGAASAGATEEPGDGPPVVVDVGNECVYAPTPAGQNTNRLRIVLGAGHVYDVSVDGAPVQPNDGDAFDTTAADADTAFFHDVPVVSASQPNTVVISHEATQLHESTVRSGDCYQQATTLTITKSSGQIESGESVVIGGVLRTTENTPVAGATVKLERRLSGGSWSSAGTTTSSGTGQISLANTPARAADYRWVYAGTGRFASKTSTVTSVAVQQPTTLAITSSASKIKRGESITVSGELRTSSGAVVKNEPVVFQRRFVGASSWTTAGSVDTNSSGKVSFTAKPTRDTQYRLQHRPTSAYGASEATTTVRVQQPTALTISRSTSTLTAGKLATISGRLRTGDGSNVKDRSVTLQRRFVGSSSWTTVTSTKSSSTGRVSFTVKPTRHTEYRLRHSSTTSFGASTSAITKLSVRPAFTLSNSRLAGLLGRTTTLKGSVSPSYSTQKIQLQQLVSGSWRTVQTKKPTSSGTYSFSVKPSSTGSRSYRVRIPATSRHLSVTSSTKKIVRYSAKITSILYDAPGDDRYNLNGEYMVVKNTGSVTINLKDWVVDATPQRRALPSYTLKPGASVRIHTGSGKQSSGRIYLGYKAPIWNNDGDTGRLYDPYGSRASTYTY
ncbi:lamin tail domain-containing protein [Phytoactinopolyspora alkaliphila]|uniref:Lamin tail domain-containing protein n=1 Tax=Phytoactinopolyspora alkaliphila TaxID=1783498 RepID=A0A6N9YQG5_9ACTN|nr:lamin tail domain-containing protein [Phytoactinopolyspora alkaliphila]NED97214.1 lamin tail domain-containing protein [Phytoactinopolyspora alkaliphila]